MLHSPAKSARERIAAITHHPAIAAALVTCCVALSLPPAPMPSAHRIFDRDATITLATAQVPVEIDSFYFFVLDTETSVEQDGAELATTLRRAAVEHDYLGIIGPDPERNRLTLLAALEAARGKTLAGVIVIYVGPIEQVDDLLPRVRASGAELRFVVLPEPEGQAI